MPGHEENQFDDNLRNLDEGSVQNEIYHSRYAKGIGFLAMALGGYLSATDTIPALVNAINEQSVVDIVKYSIASSFTVGFVVLGFKVYSVYQKRLELAQTNQQINDIAKEEDL